MSGLLYGIIYYIMSFFMAPESKKPAYQPVYVRSTYRRDNDLS